MEERGRGEERWKKNKVKMYAKMNKNVARHCSSITTLLAGK